MKYLLDTNALLFVFSAPSKLSVSVVSFWEIAIKQSIGKLQFNMTIPNLESLCIGRNIQILSLGSTAIERIKALPTIHGDPFDRLIIAQAQMEDMTIVTCDKIMPQYPVKTVW